jgi:hypothetical protein
MLQGLVLKARLAQGQRTVPASMSGCPAPSIGVVCFSSGAVIGSGGLSGLSKAPIGFHIRTLDISQSPRIIAHSPQQVGN